MAHVELKELRKHQREDPVLGIWIRAVYVDKKPPKKEVITRSPQHQTMSRHFKSFTVIRWLLYRENGEKGKQLVLPAIYKHVVLHSLHDDIDHPARERYTRNTLLARLYC